MRPKLLSFIMAALIICALFGLTSVPTQAKPSKDAIQAGATMPALTLPKPASKADQEYLGLAKSEPFTISQLSAKLVLIEVFSTT